MNRMARIEPLRNAAKGLEDLHVYSKSAQHREKVWKTLMSIETAGTRRKGPLGPSSLFASDARFIIKVLTDLENRLDTFSIDM